MLNLLFTVTSVLWLIMTFVVLTLYVLQYYDRERFENAYRACRWILLRVLLPPLTVLIFLKEIVFR